MGSLLTHNFVAWLCEQASNVRQRLYSCRGERSIGYGGRAMWMESEQCKVDEGRAMGAAARGFCEH